MTSVGVLSAQEHVIGLYLQELLRGMLWTIAYVSLSKMDLPNASVVSIRIEDMMPLFYLLDFSFSCYGFSLGSYGDKPPLDILECHRTCLYNC